jgi:hypothetical protein
VGELETRGGRGTRADDDGAVTEGVDTDGALPTGVETDGTVTDGTVTDGVDTDGVFTDGSVAALLESDSTSRTINSRTASELPAIANRRPIRISTADLAGLPATVSPAGPLCQLLPKLL